MLSRAELIYNIRKWRTRCFDSDIFSEPGWDILLDLYIHHVKGRKLKITGLSQGNDIPTSTALRWLQVLERKGLISREDSCSDSRITWIVITPGGVARMQHFLTHGGSIGSSERFDWPMTF